jgi:mannosyltransferase OCH1-like enzyme
MVRLRPKYILVALLGASVAWHTLRSVLVDNAKQGDAARSASLTSELTAEMRTNITARLEAGVAQLINLHEKTTPVQQLSFPKIIHQTSPRLYGVRLQKALSWIYANKGMNYRHWDDMEASEFVRLNAKDAFPIYSSLKSPVARADIFRYLILHRIGGLYTDIDTTALRPLHTWIPPEFNQSKINLVVGVEVDEPNIRDPTAILNWGWASNFHICQYTILARPQHPVLSSALKLTIENLEKLAMQRKTSIKQLKLSKVDVVRQTGPGPFTKAVLSYLQVKPKDLHGLTKPKQVKDVLVLPITAFGPNQRHSNSGRSDDPRHAMDVHLLHRFQSNEGLS